MVANEGEEILCSCVFGEVIKKEIGWPGIRLCNGYVKWRWALATKLATTVVFWPTTIIVTCLVLTRLGPDTRRTYYHPSLPHVVTKLSSYFDIYVCTFRSGLRQCHCLIPLLHRRLSEAIAQGFPNWLPF